MYQLLLYHPETIHSEVLLSQEYFRQHHRHNQTGVLDYVLHHKPDVLLACGISDDELLGLASRLKTLNIPVPMIYCCGDVTAELRRMADAFAVIALPCEDFSHLAVRYTLCDLLGLPPDAVVPSATKRKPKTTASKKKGGTKRTPLISGFCNLFTYALPSIVAN